MKRKFYIFMALLSGLIFGITVFYYLQNIKTPSLTETKPLVIAVTDIPARSMISNEQLQVKNIPIEGYPQGGASSIQEVSGKVLLVNLVKNDVILSSMLEPTSKTFTPSSESYSFTVPQGKRAVAIELGNSETVNNKIKPGDRVDILVTMDIRLENGDAKPVTALAAQDVLVLNTGQTTIQDNEKIPSSSSYVLALSVAQSMAITLGTEKGSVRLILRNPANKEIFTEKPIDPSLYLSPDYFNHYK